MRKKNDEPVESSKRNFIEIGHKRTNSNEKEEYERENHVIHAHKKTEKSLSRKKGLGSTGKIIKYSRGKYESPKRTEDSLEKEEHNAKMMKTQLINNLMTNHTGPDYMIKLKAKKREIMERKKIPKRSIINVNIELKPEEAIKCYEVYGELGKGAYGTVRMGIDKRTGEKVAIKVYEKKRLDEPNKIKNLER